MVKRCFCLDSDTLFPIFISFPNVKGYKLISTTIQSVWETYFQMMQHYGRWEMGRMSSGPIIGQQKTVLLLDWSRMCCEVFQDISKWEAIREMKSITFHFQSSIGKTKHDIPSNASLAAAFKSLMVATFNNKIFTCRILLTIVDKISKCVSRAKEEIVLLT